MNFHLKTALSSLRRAPFQAFAAIFVLTITFFVGTAFSILIYSSSKVLSYFETRPQVIAFIKDGSALEAIASLQHKLDADIRIKDVRYVSKEEALSIYKDATSDNPLLSELVSPSIFPASLEFSLSDLSFAEDVIKEVKNENLVDSVGFTASLGGEKTLQDVVDRLRKVTYYIRLGGGVFAAVLMGTSFVVLMIIISMRMIGRKDEVEILKLIGAKSGFIRSPIIIEAVIYALIGVFVGWLLALILVLYIAPWAISYFGQIPVLPREPLSFFTIFAIILAAELLIGVLLALGGSSLALSRVRRKK